MRTLTLHEPERMARFAMMHEMPISYDFVRDIGPIPEDQGAFKPLI